MPVSLSNIRDLLLPGLRQISHNIAAISQVRANLLPALHSISSDTHCAFDLIPNHLNDSLDLAIADHGNEKYVRDFITRAEIDDRTYINDFESRVLRAINRPTVLPSSSVDISAFSLDELEAAADYIENNK